MFIIGVSLGLMATVTSLYIFYRSYQAPTWGETIAIRFLALSILVVAAVIFKIIDEAAARGMV